MTAVPETKAGPLRWLADNYQQVQRVRIRVGEQIRAVVQGRDPTLVADVGDVELSEREADKLLKSILAGESDGPVPVMGRSYRTQYTEERAVFDAMTRALETHPGWPWLSGVKGIGPTLGCYLLGLVNIEACNSVSSLWKFAGLATVPGELYRCVTCGIEFGFPVGTQVTGNHQVLGGTKQCKGKLQFVTRDEVRVAEPRAVRGEKRTYNAFLKSKVYLCATSFLKAGGPYEEFYRSERAKAEAERPRWREGRKHFLALRKMEKLFLSHLWQTWRTASGLPVGEPFAYGVLEHDYHNWQDPWDYTSTAKPSS